MPEAAACAPGIVDEGATRPRATAPLSNSHDGPSPILESYRALQAVHPCRTIVVVGPPRDRIGGMSTVVTQMLKADMRDDFRYQEFPLSLRDQHPEGMWRRCERHLAQLRRFGRTIVDVSAFAVHLHTCSGFSFFHAAALARIARRRAARVVLHVHGAAFDRFHAECGLLPRRIVRAALRRANRVVVLSEGWRNIIAAMSPDAHIEVIENAVDVGPWRERPGDHAECRLLTLAGMDEWKGIDDLLDACALAKSHGARIQAVLAGPVGSAGDANILSSKIARRGLADTARYVGPAGMEEKARWLDWADVYVQPSRHEGMPLAVLEAMAAGLPVIATRAGAMPEIVAHGISGLTVPVRDAEALSGAIRTLSNNRAMRQRFGRAGHETAASRFSGDRFIRDLHRLYHSLATV